ncbi:Hyalin [Holothuria leucospilota]|uniref:Hyalin n=1 Tax=Holothuria leucospilota TaxID=206669 RepID=A0A9Q1C9A3_HOLLE|nr:Hyalin [Holothuria leucospilota]
MANFYGAFVTLVTVWSIVNKPGEAQGQQPCPTNICSNGGTCFLTFPSGILCICPPGFSGNICENSVSELTPCSPSEQQQCGNTQFIPTGELPCFSNGTGPANFICNCGSVTDTNVFPFARFNIGRLCGSPIPPSITLTSLETCYGCPQDFFRSINYPNLYETGRGDVYLLYIPGASEINFEFSVPFSVEAKKDDLFVGAGLEFSSDEVNAIGVEPGPQIVGRLYFFDNRLITPEGQDDPTPGATPPPFTIIGDTAWVYFRTDRNIEEVGFELTWTFVAADTTPPVPTCPEDITRGVSPGTTEVAVTFTQPFAIDAVDGLATVVSQSHSSGQSFTVGTTTVTYVFSDSSNNVASCSFQVIVSIVDDTPPVVSCGPDITETIPLSTGGLVINFPDCTAVDDSGTAILVSRTHRPGDFFTTGSVIVTYTFTDSSGNTASGSFRITVLEVDTIPPVVTCPADITRTIGILTGGTTVSFTEATATDNSGTATLASRSHTSGSFFVTGSTTVTYTFVDPSGNSASCSFEILIIEVDQTPPVVVCPADVTTITEILSGGITVNFEEATATDNSGVVTLQSRSHATGSRFNTGTTEVTYTFVDPSGNSAFCSFRVTVIEVDTIPPMVLNCPSDITRNLVLGDTVSATWQIIRATDNSGAAPVESCSHQRGQQFPFGITDVTCTYTDPSGNSSPCNFRVLVLTGPQLDCCPADISRTVPLGQPSLVVTYSLDCNTDNLGITLVDSTHQSGFSFPVGRTIVTLTFQDSDNFQATCSFEIIIIEVDRTPPVVTCPDDITRTIEILTGGTTVSFTEATATDNSGTVTLASRSHAPGSFFVTGSTTVTYTFVDPSGNSASCSFEITIIEVDRIRPVVTCPDDITRTIEILTGGTTVSFAEATATDNSGTATLASRSHSPGSFFVTGSTTVTYTFVDPSGNSASCSFEITIIEVDRIRPVVTCPDDITRTIEILTGGTTVSFAEATATDNSGTATLASRSHSPGSFFVTGSTTVTYTFVDSSGNSASCSFEITIIEVDRIRPVVTCPDDIARTIEILTGGTTVSFAEATATDNSGTATLASRSHSSGSFFGTGSTTVTYTFVDPSGNSASCSFEITIIEVDRIRPFVTCPEDVTRTIEILTGGTTVSFAEATATDNSGTATLASRSHSPGSFFVTGSTTVTYTFVDPSGNSASCSFEITIIEVDRIRPVVTCPDDITRTIEILTGGTTVSFAEATATDNSGTATLASRSHTPGSFFVTGSTTVTYTFVDPSGNSASCSFEITIIEVDRIPPVVTCPDDMSRSIQILTGGTTVFFIEPTATDNSGTATLASRSHTPGSFFVTGTTTVTYTFVDPSGNSASCSFQIVIIEIDTIPPEVDCPEDRTVEVEISAGGAVVSFVEPTATDNSGVVLLVSRSDAPSSFFPVGKTTVVYIFEDQAGNRATCEFCIIVIAVDRTPPVVTCPDDITRTIEILTGGTTVSFTEATATDNSGTATLVSRSHAPGSFFVTGSTTVTYTFVDPTGNSASCSFQIIIVEVDTIPPVVTCPADITRTIEILTGGTTVSFTEATATDNSGTATLASRSHAPGSFFATGTTTVTYNFVDPGGNTGTCSFQIIIIEVDTTPPVVNCVDDITRNADIQSNGVTVIFAEPTATDNSGTVSVVTRSNPPGSFFNIGTTTVTYVFEDPSNNRATCVFRVIIVPVDTDPPMLLCPGNIVLTVLSGVNSIPIQWPLPIVSDISEPVTLVSASHNPGAEFPVGITTVRYEYADAFENTASCTFNIRIMIESPCVVNPCNNGGTCVAVDLDRTSCVCPRCFTGDFCQIAVDVCSGNMCTFGSTCVPVPGSCEQYTCNCPPCFTGPFCNIAGDVCAGNECSNGGFCQPDPTDCTRYTCVCPSCFSGPFCQIRANGCSPNPCQNNAVCTDLSATECNAYRCDCVGCFDGFNCERAIPNPCNQNPCLNGGTCTRNLQFCASYTCRCIPGFDGDICQRRPVDLFNPCNSFPCENGGSCCSQESDTNYVCVCPQGYAGINCGMIAATGADLCLGNPCQNGGSCFASYYSGSSSFMYTPQYMCLCAAGFTGNNCQFNVFTIPSQDVCSMDRGVCQNGGICTNTFNSFTSDVDFKCTNCPASAIGQTCEVIVPDACISSPCINSGTCVTESGGFRCICNPAFQGTFCQIPGPDFQPPVISGCPGDFSQMGPSPVIFTPPQATDNSGYVRLLFMSHTPGQVFPVGITAVSFVFGDAAGNQNECTFYVTITDGGLPFYIVVSRCPGNIVAQTSGSSANVMFETPIAVSRDGGVSLVSQSHNSGSSFPVGTTTPVSFIFRDAAGNQAECNFDVTVRRVDDCFRVCTQQFNPVCGSDGITYSNLCEFEAAQCRVPSLTFTPGPCDDNPCSSSPCLGGGTCFMTGNGFLCLCTAGRSGDRCEIVIDDDPCLPSPCENDGTCLPFMNNFVCICLPGFTGDVCEQGIPCNPNPCLGGGTCFQLADNSFVCVCTPGRTGQRCEITGPCNPDPCLNGGTCFDALGLPGGFFCNCPSGFSGDRCEDSPGPCDPDPCLNGGTCFDVPSLPGGFFCNCRSGFSGDRCEDSPGPCNPDPCLNGGTCFDALGLPGGFFCNCPSGFSGDRCEDSPGPCDPDPCLNGGTCFDALGLPGGFFCNCPSGFSGDRCEDSPGPCDPDPCLNGGTCFDAIGLPGGFFCNCPSGFSGDRCEDSPGPCSSNPCQAGGTCNMISVTPGIVNIDCTCPPSRTGVFCETVITGQLTVDSSLCQDRTVTLPPQNLFVQVSIIVPNATFNGVIVPPISFAEDVISLTTTNYFLLEGSSRFIFNYEFESLGRTLTAACDFTVVVSSPPLVGKRSVDDKEMFSEDVSLCNPNPCRNEGQCHLLLSEDDTTLVPYCECVEGWTGPTCTTSVSYVSQFHETVEMWTLLVILVVVVLTFALMVCQYQRRCFQRRQYQDEKVVIQ